MIVGFSCNKPTHTFKLGTTTALWENPTVADFINAKEKGFEYLEVAFNQCYRNVPEDELLSCLTRMKEKIDSAGLKVWSVHLPFSRTLDISVLDDYEREKNVRFIAQMIELSAMFNPSRLVLHPSSEPIDDSIREQRIINSIHSIGLLRKYADKIGAQLCIENLPRTCLGNTPEELLRIIEDYPEVGICFDTNHYFEGTPLDFVRKAGHRITTLHVSDYDGINECHWIPGEGVIQWGELVKALIEAGFDGVFMFETVRDKENNRVSIEQLAKSFEMILKELK